MLPSTVRPPGTYNPYLTALDDAGGAVEVKRNLPDDDGLHLVFARDLRGSTTDGGGS